MLNRFENDSSPKKRAKCRNQLAVVVAQVEAHQTMNRVVPGSIPAGSLAFFSSLLFSIISEVCP